MTSILAGTDQMGLPLQAREERELAHGPLRLKAFRFNVLDYRGRETWVAAIYGAPDGAGPFPGIVHVHGGGQTVSADDVAWCVNRGYAAISFDYTGPKEDRDFVTEWAKDVGGYLTIRPEPDASLLYHAVAAARRAITFIAARPEVDPERIGSYGISWGGYVMWLVNGADDRLKAAVPIYGCGILRPGHICDGEHQFAEDERILWRDSYEPSSYARLQHAPLLFLNGTNDFFGWPSMAAKLSPIVNAPLRMHFSANFNHHVEPPGARAAEAFFRWLLAGGPAMPATPQVALAADGDELRAEVRPDQPERVERVDILYSLGADFEPDRCWRTAKAKGAAWSVDLADARFSERIDVIAEVTYKEGYALSSIPLLREMREFFPAGPLTPPSREYLYRPGDGLAGGCDGVCGAAGTQLYERAIWFETERDGGGAEKCLVCRLAPKATAFSFASRRPADPCYRADAQVRAVEIVFEASGGAGFVLAVKKLGVVDQADEFSFEIGDAGDGRRTVRAAAADFAHPSRKTLDGFAGVGLVRLYGELPPGGAVRVYSLRWLR